MKHRERLAARDREFDMARFHFALQPALERAYANETLARAVVVEARLAADGAAVALAAVESRISDVRAATSALATQGAGELAATEAAGIALSFWHRRRVAMVERSQAALARARSVYVTVTRQRGALERLRERRLADFDRLVALAEEAETDERNCRRSDEAGESSMRSFGA